MVSLIVHAVLGIGTLLLIIKLNPAIYRRPASGPAFSTVELIYYAVGVASIAVGWYFNIKFMTEYQTDGDALSGWSNFTKLTFANPAASSISQDFDFINLVLLPMFTIIDGRRRGLRHTWLYVVNSLFASCTFTLAFYFATVERDRRHRLVGEDLLPAR